MSSKLVGLDGCAVKTVDRARVAETQRLLINRDEAGRLAQLFRLLGDPGRARILYALLEAGELCVCDLAATVEMAETAGMVEMAARWWMLFRSRRPRMPATVDMADTSPGTPRRRELPVAPAATVASVARSARVVTAAPAEMAAAQWRSPIRVSVFSRRVVVVTVATTAAVGMPATAVTPVT